MNYKNYLQAVRQGYEDPTQYEPKKRYCEICDIEEEKTYFIEDQNICQDCHKEQEEDENN